LTVHHVLSPSSFARCSVVRFATAQNPRHKLDEVFHDQQHTDVWWNCKDFFLKF
jgi:hypothetical protein